MSIFHEIYGMQVIENQFRQNLQTIEDLMQLIWRSHAQV
jgi:hypothetical protein